MNTIATATSEPVRCDPPALPPEQLAANRRRVLKIRARNKVQALENSWGAGRKPRTCRRDFGDLGKRVGSMIKALRDDDVDSSDLAELLNDATEAKVRLYDALEDACSGQLSDYVEHCCDCGEYFSTNNGGGHTDDGQLCDVCVNNYYYSECMSTYIHSNDAIAVYDSARAHRNGDANDYCTQRFGRNNFYQLDDGAFADCEETRADIDGYEDDGEDDEDDEESQDRRDGLSSYHGSYRKWVENNATPNVPALGVELEVYAEDRGDTVQAVKDAAPSNWYFESDGSLDSEYGFEIISQPHGYTEWKRIAPDVLGALNGSGAVAYTQPSPDRNYGIHINIHRRHLSPLQEARMLMFMMSRNNREFMQCIAQRAKIYGGGAVQMGDLEARQETVTNTGGLTAVRQLSSGEIVRKPQGRGKYSPINMRDVVAEIRIFQSTLHLPSFMKNLEFTWALIEWTSTKAATGISWRHQDFVSWLGNYGTESRYPNLFAYLRKPSYMGKGFESKITNTWVDLLPSQTTKSMDTVTGDADQRLAA